MDASGSWVRLKYWPDAPQCNWEFWTDGRDVYRRRVSDFNYQTLGGAPVGARWECSLVHFNRTMREGM